jgi:hypothetical protein
MFDAYNCLAEPCAPKLYNEYVFFFFFFFTYKYLVMSYHYWTSSAPDVNGSRGQINNQLSGQNWGIGSGMREGKGREGMD